MPEAAPVNVLFVYVLVPVVTTMLPGEEPAP